MKLDENYYLADMLRKGEPCALSFRSGDNKLGYGVPYRVKWSGKVLDHLELYSVPDETFVDLVRKDDPNVFFFNLERMEKPERKVEYKIAISDGTFKTIKSPRDVFYGSESLESDVVIVQTPVDSALDLIIMDFANEGAEQFEAYKSLINLSNFVNNDEYTAMFEVKRVHGADVVERFYVGVGSNTTTEWEVALKRVAHFLGWKVRKEEYLG